MKSCLTFLCIAAIAVPSALAQTQSDPFEPIVQAIGELEGRSDPKCHATATRLENFMYGTPLTEEAREAKVELQKGLLINIWKKASVAAAASGEATVSGDRIEPFIEERFAYVIDESGAASVKTESGRTLSLLEPDLRQYSSVAYALRAILAVQQEALLSPELNLLPLAPEAITELKRLIDVRTLATLQEGDRIARASDSPEVTAEIFRKAWREVGNAPAAAAAQVAEAPVVPGELLRRIIDQKMKSYQKYNQISDPLFFSNTRVFYARYEWPAESERVAAITSEFSRVIMDFVARSMIEAQKKAIAEGRPLVRESDVSEVWREIAPFRVNEFEDIQYFYNLPREQQVTIEAYDADSFRDSGVHWLLIRQVLDHPSMPLRVDYDPFAAELLAEGVAQMGVLLFRLAGNTARAAGAETLESSHVALAEKEIARRMKAHLEAPARPRPEAASRIASAPARTSGAGFFVDATSETGLDFVHRTSDWLSRFQRSFLYTTHGAPDAPRPGSGAAAHDVAPSFSGSGVAADDVDGDGIADLLIVGGAGNRLYRGTGDGRFEDITATAGIQAHGTDGKPGEPRQPLIVDFDNDGVQDLFITYVDAPHRLYRGLGGGRFEDVSARAGLGGDGLVAGAATAFDYDNDGLVDLYIGYYGNYVEGVGPNLSRRNDNASPNRLFRNKGEFLFEDVTESSGTGNRGWTQAVAHADLDADGWQDLVVGNDFGVNAWFRNRGDGSFEDMAPRWGTDLPSNAMNVGTSDLNGDGFPEVYISNILTMVKDEKYVLPTETTRMKLDPEKLSTMRIVGMNHLFASVANDGKLARYELSEAVDRGETSTGWAWDADFFDFDLDGDDDLYVVNGLNEYNQYAAQFATETPDGNRQTWMFSVHPQEKNVFFVNEGGKLRNRSSASGADFSGNSRAAAYLDFDLDGDLDVIVNNFQSAATVLRNDAPPAGNHWIAIELEGDPAQGVNRNAIGARIEATLPNGQRITRWVQGGTGYLSQHPREQYFGLGSAGTARVRVVWPGGRRQELGELEAGRRWKVRIGSDAVEKAVGEGAAGKSRKISSGS